MKKSDWIPPFPALRALIDAGDAQGISRALHEEAVGDESEHGMTALMIAAREGYSDCVRILARDLATEDIVLSNHHGEDALAIAAYAGDSESLEILLPHFVALGEPARLQIAIQTAVLSGDGPSVSAMLSCNDPNQYHDIHKSRNATLGVPLLHFAAERDAHEAVLALLVDTRCQPDLLSRGGATALMLAARRNAVQAIRALAPRSNADLMAHEGRTALMTAAFLGHAQAVEALLPVSDPHLLSNEKSRHPFVNAFEMALREKKWPAMDILAPFEPLADIQRLVAEAPAERFPRARAWVEAQAIQAAMREGAEKAREIRALSAPNSIESPPAAALGPGPLADSSSNSFAAPRRPPRSL